MKLILLLYTGICFSMVGQAQVSMTGNLLTHIDSIIAAMPSGIGTNEFRLPTDAQRSEWKICVQSVLTKEYPSAAVSAHSIGYQLIHFTDTADQQSSVYYILEKRKDSANYWGTYVINPQAKRSALIIQSPHELFDSKTGGQGSYIFQQLSASVFCLNGTHRCNNNTASQCSGTTTVCTGSNDPFRISDDAHTQQGIFQATTEVLISHNSASIVVQLHGFGKSAGDPDVILGNGTTFAPTGTDHLINFKNALSTIDTSLTFKIAHIDTAWTDLTGTTNTQGRLVNGSINPCSSKAQTASGQFLHIEQAYAKLRDTKTDWQKVADALRETFPVDPTHVMDQHQINQFDLFQNYPNPFNPSTTISYQLPMSSMVTVRVFDLLGREVALIVNEHKDAGKYTVQFTATNLASGIYLYRLKAGSFSAVKKFIMLK